MLNIVCINCDEPCDMTIDASKSSNAATGGGNFPSYSSVINSKCDALDELLIFSIIR